MTEFNLTAIGDINLPVSIVRLVFTTGLCPIFFRLNPRYDKGFKRYFISYKDVHKYHIIISGSNDESENSYELLGEPVVSYTSIAAMFEQGWIFGGINPSVNDWIEYSCNHGILNPMISECLKSSPESAWPGYNDSDSRELTSPIGWYNWAREYNVSTAVIDYLSLHINTHKRIISEEQIYQINQMEHNYPSEMPLFLKSNPKYPEFSCYFIFPNKNLPINKIIVVGIDNYMDGPEILKGAKPFKYYSTPEEFVKDGWMLD